LSERPAACKHGGSAEPPRQSQTENDSAQPGGKGHEGGLDQGRRRQNGCRKGNKAVQILRAGGVAFPAGPQTHRPRPENARQHPPGPQGHDGVGQARGHPQRQAEGGLQELDESFDRRATPLCTRRLPGRAGRAVNVCRRAWRPTIRPRCVLPAMAIV